MIEIHAHVIHGVDDGPQTLKDAITLLEQAVAHGVNDVITTTHYQKDLYQNDKLLLQYEALRQAVLENDLAINLHLGNEIYLDEYTSEKLRLNQVRTLAGSRYVLVELPYHHIMPYHEDLLYQLQLNGYFVILAHFERYQYLTLEKAEEWVKKGYYLQMNASYLLHHSNKAKQALDRGIVHFIASDMHHHETRPCQLREAYQKIEKWYDQTHAEALFHRHPIHILENRQLSPNGALWHKKKWWHLK